MPHLKFTTVKLKPRHHLVPEPPFHATPGSAGADLRSDEDVVVQPGHWMKVSSGYDVEVAEGFEMQVRPRSGLAGKYGVTVLNSPGTIDSDYRGELCVMLVNHGNEPFVVKRGDRIAQLVVGPVFKTKYEIVEELSETRRGTAGFGSTGV